MKKTETVEKIICDFCEVNEAAYRPCMGCGKAICYDCRKTVAKEYNHAVYFQGSDDGLYCLECDIRLTATGDPLHASYRVIGFLCDEMKGWGEDFKKRSDKAEANLKRLRALSASGNDA